MTDGDWRFTNQEAYLSGATFLLKEWSPSSEGSDHDHCEFCWAKFGAHDASEPDRLRVGYSTAGSPESPRLDYFWVCEACFDDFRERLRFKVAV